MIVPDHQLFLAGAWAAGSGRLDVRSPYDDAVVGRVAPADAALVDRAVEAAQAALATGSFPQYERAAVLERAAAAVDDRTEELAAVVAGEAGKPIRTARAEVRRCASTFVFSAVEARRLTGTTVPMDASEAGHGKLGLTFRVPIGVVGAISSFNFPLNLVAHKLGPAIAAGNAIVLKPADQTPISALKLAEILQGAGLPDGWLSVLPGGVEVGERIVSHPGTKAITFTGSAAVGWEIRRRAPEKKVNLELGSSAPLIVDEDGDWEAAADGAAIHAFSHAGQSCISVQRILVHDAIAERFTERLKANVERLVVGDPMNEATDVGPLIGGTDRDRVKAWIDEALADGAELVSGGEMIDAGRCLAPTILSKAPREAKVWREEVFGPVVTLDRFGRFGEALALANDSRYGLQAGVFTRDIGRALEAAKVLEFGGVLINEVPTFRADQQPYGGIKDSGNTREGPAYAILELTEERFLGLSG
ncbi:MAG: aldehyde dehydrogenase family protein [Actinobacteria bacterium]|nr:aldehyde dehydrogenase family protein [Actinomycetota bacterium]